MAIWEPVRYAVGDRVRVRVSPECPHYGELMFHRPQYHGAVVVVRDIWIGSGPPFLQGHRFVVWSEDGNAGVLAATEMEPLTAPRGGEHD